MIELQGGIKNILNVVDMFLADVESRLYVEIDDNRGRFYEMPNSLNDSSTSIKGLDSLMRYLFCDAKELENFLKLSLESGHFIPKKVLVLKNAKWLSFTFKSFDTYNNKGMVHHRL